MPKYTDLPIEKMEKIEPPADFYISSTEVLEDLIRLRAPQEVYCRILNGVKTGPVSNNVYGFLLNCCSRISKDQTPPESSIDNPTDEAPQCPYCGQQMLVQEVQGSLRQESDWYCSCPDEGCPGYISESEGQWHTREAAVAAYRKRTEAVCELDIQEILEIKCLVSGVPVAAEDMSEAQLSAAHLEARRLQIEVERRLNAGGKGPLEEEVPK